MESKNSLLKNIVVYFINALLTAALGVGINKVFAIFIDPSEYGIYSLFFEIYSLAVSMVFMVFTNSILRYYGDFKNRNSEKLIYASIFKMLFVTSLVLVALCCVGLPIVYLMIPEKMFFVLALGFSLLFLPDGVKQISIAFARCQGKAKKQTLANIIEHSVKLIVFLAFFFLIQKSVVGIIVASIASFITSIVLLYDCWSVPKKLFKIETKETTKKLLRFGLPLIGIPVVNYLLASSDQLIISFFWGTAATGIYSMGYRISFSLFSLITGFLITACHHVVMETYDSGEIDKAKKIVKDMSLAYWIICIPFLIEVFVFSKYVLAVLASENYLDSSFVLSFSSIGIVFCGFVNYTNKPWEASKRSWAIMLFSAVGAILNIVLNFLLIPTFGYNVAAITTIVSYFFVIVLSYVFGRKTLDVLPNIGDILKLLLAFVIMLSFTDFTAHYFVSHFWQFVVFAFASLLLYCLICFFLLKRKIFEIVKLFKNIDG